MTVKLSSLIITFPGSNRILVFEIIVLISLSQSLADLTFGLGANFSLYLVEIL